jgi:dephospho-CoA kinase
MKQPRGITIVGLTGGIGMGKSTAAAAFRRARIPVFDADIAVHRMQGPGGRAVRAIEQAFPGTVVEGRRGRQVDRNRLREAVLGQPEALKRLEALLHPMVEAEELAFVRRARRHGHRIVVLDIPLLFEVEGDRRVHHVVVVTAPRAVQVHRVRLRRRMSEADIVAIIERQMPDREKRRRADTIISTGLSRHRAQRALRALIARLRQGAAQGAGQGTGQGVARGARRRARQGGRQGARQGARP